MYEEIYNKFKICACEKCNINLSNKKIVAAVSGGSDSVCMLLLLNKLFGPDNIVCAHFNHKIRIGDTDRDADFVRKLSKSLNIDFEYDEADVPSYAKNKHLGLEEAARILRYEFLKRIANDNFVAVAHNKGDKVETILHNISRGASIDGLKGIEYKRGNIVRPVLDLSKKEIEYICDYFDIKPVFDKTNNDNSYKRNNIRNKVLPFLKIELGENIENQLLRLSESATINSNFLEKYTREIYEKSCIVQTLPFFKIVLKYDSFTQLDIAIKRRLIRYILSQIKDGNNNYVFPEYTGIYSDMILRVENAMGIRDVGKIVEVSSGVICVSDYEGIYFTHKDNICDDEKHFNKINFYEIDISKNDKIDFKNKPQNIEYFDFNVLESLYGENFKEKICMKKWEDDDVICPIGMENRKKIRDVLINSKIGRFERQFVNVVSIDNDVLWIPNIKRSNIAPIDKNSSRVIIIECVSE